MKDKLKIQEKPKIHLQCWIDEKDMVHRVHDISRGTTVNQLSILIFNMQILLQEMTRKMVKDHGGRIKDEY